MFAYCLNNPANFIDSCGFDAVWIQESDSAAGFGHSGLLVENQENGEWYYFYWGPVSESESPLTLATTGTMANIVFVKVEVGEANLYSTEDLIEVIQNSNDAFVSSRAELVTDSFYLEGDYSDTFDYLMELSAPEERRYHLLINNCVQEVWIALGKSNPWFLFEGSPVIPDLAYSKVLFYSGQFEDCGSFIVRQICK